MPAVLILGGRAPTALDHARRFAHQGWTVHVADSMACRLSGWSRAVTSTIRVAPPRYAPEKFAADLSSVIARHGIDLVLPTCEEVFYLSRYRSALPQGVRVLAERFELLRELHSKWRFLSLARECGARVPDSALVHTLAEARAWAGDAPVVLKPEYSRFGVHVRLHPHGLPADAPELNAADAPWVVQRFAPGTEVCSYSIADRGGLRAHALYRPSHRIGGSSSYYFEPAASQAVRDFVARFAAHTGFTGQVSFDWILDADGAPTVLECNPRATSGLHLFAPFDPLPAALMGAGTEEGDACIEPGQPRPAMIGSVMLGAGLPSALRHGRLGSWWRDYRAACDVVSVPGDARPLLGGLLDLAGLARQALAQGSSVREAATRDIEWDGEALPCG